MKGTADIGDRFEDILVHLKSLNQSYEQILIYAARMLAEAKIDIRIAKDEADAAKAANSRAQGFIEELMKDFEGIEAMTFTLLSKDQDAMSKTIDELQRQVIAEERKPRSIGGRNRAKIDPRTKEKEFVLGCWLEWKMKPTNYKRKAEFASDMIDKCEKLKSTNVIENWCREWDKALVAIALFNDSYAKWNISPSLYVSDDELFQAMNEKSPYIRKHGLHVVLHLLEQMIALNNRNSPEPNRNPTS